MVSYKIKNITLQALVGIQLSGLLLKPEKPKAVIQFNGATAVPKEFYLGLASYFASQNYACLLFDYRGICSSKPPEGLKGCDYELIDWGKQDIAAGIDYLRSKFPKLPLFGIGHSVGGQLIGLAPNINEFKGFLAIAVSGGYSGAMPWKYRIQSFFFFHVVRPMTHFLYGYTKVKFLGIMQDMPKRVTNKWKQWCSEPNYVFNPKNFLEIKDFEQYCQLDFPIHVFSTEDDNIATSLNVSNLWKHIESSRGIEMQLLKPKNYKIKAIGHFGFFSRKTKDLFWPMALKKIEEFNEE